MKQCARIASLAIFLALAASAASAPAHLDLDVRFEPASGRLEAVAELVAPAPLELALHESLTVRAASARGQPLAFTSASAGGALRVWRIAAGDGTRVRIVYGGTLPPLDPALDHRAVLQMSIPMASAQGSFLPAGSGWYPRPSERYSYAVRLSLPGEQRGIVPGRLTAESLPTHETRRYVARFELAQASDGIHLMTGPYVVRERLVARQDAEPLRLRTYFYPDLGPLSDDYLEASRRFIALYSERIGAYPYTSFSVVAGPLPTGFGMPTLTYLGARVVKLPFIREISLRHEVLHNWWGNGVFVDYARGNWAEGLTTFMADYAHREEQSESAARDMRFAWLRDFAAVPENASLPLTQFRARTHAAEAAVGYGKSAMVFLMLRDLIGEEAFSRALRTFWAEHRFSTASWDDLREAFESAAARPLDAFFVQWLERRGGPRLSVTDARLRRTREGARLALTLAQTRPPYSLEVPIELVYADGSEIRRMPITTERTRVELEVERAPEFVRLDPEFRLWRALEPEAAPPILRQWMMAKSPLIAVVTADAQFDGAARRLAQVFFESPATVVPTEQARSKREPLLIIGRHEDVDAALARLGAPPRPQALAGRGTAQAWTVTRTAAGGPLAAISAHDVAALEALARPLPHYGAQSYLVFDGSQAIERGVWPASVPLVPVRREE